MATYTAALDAIFPDPPERTDAENFFSAAAEKARALLEKLRTARLADELPPLRREARATTAELLAFSKSVKLVRQSELDAYKTAASVAVAALSLAVSRYEKEVGPVLDAALAGKIDEFGARVLDAEQAGLGTKTLARLQRDQGAGETLARLAARDDHHLTPADAEPHLAALEMKFPTQVAELRRKIARSHTKRVSVAVLEKTESLTEAKPHLAALEHAGFAELAAMYRREVEAKVFDYRKLGIAPMRDYAGEHRAALEKDEGRKLLEQYRSMPEGEIRRAFFNENFAAMLAAEQAEKGLPQIGNA